MNFSEILDILNRKCPSKITQTELGVMLNKTRSDINSKIKRGSEIKLSEIEKIRHYVLEKYKINVDFSNVVNFQANNSDLSDEEIYSKIALALGIDKNCSKIIQSSGDSMAPTIIEGDKLLINLSQKIIHDGKIYCIEIDNKIYIKRLQTIPPTKIKVISDNFNKYDSFYLDILKQDVDYKIIGEVSWWSRMAR